GPSARRAVIRSSRASATPASPATTPPASPILKTARRRPASACSSIPARELPLPEMPSDRPLAGRIAVVTGASRGIGEAAAIALARAGAHIIALARTQGALEALDDAIRAATGEGATLAPADITDFDALDRLGQMLYERHGRIDIIVGNAGVLGPLSPLSHIAPKDFERVMAVN